MARDYKNDSTHTVIFAPKSAATNNNASSGVDLRGYNGACAVLVNFGLQTAGDNAGTMSIQLQDSATNSAAAATNITSASVTSDGNNLTTTAGQIQLVPRAQLRYLFARVIITGANSPAFPISVQMIGEKKKVS